MVRISLSTLAETPATWQGEVRNFSTQEYLVVDDFEDYNNFSPDRVFQTWIDGVGYSADEFFPVEKRERFLSTCPTQKLELV